MIPGAQLRYWGNGYAAHSSHQEPPYPPSDQVSPLSLRIARQNLASLTFWIMTRLQVDFVEDMPDLGGRSVPPARPLGDRRPSS